MTTPEWPYFTEGSLRRARLYREPQAGGVQGAELQVGASMKMQA